MNHKPDKPVVIGVAGIKNSGKTTLLTRLIPLLVQKGYRVATIKHDGHDFEADIEGTDSYRHKKAGAFATAVFSGNRYCVVKEQNHCTPEQLIALFPEADIILLEGMKGSPYPKVEVVRAEISSQIVCEPSTLLAIATDLPAGSFAQKQVHLNEPAALAQILMEYIEEEQP